MSMSIDDLDKKILKELVLDSRSSFRKIARKCKVSIATITSRVKKLKESGVIKGYTTMLDSEKLGYELTVITEIIISKGKLLEVEEKIKHIPNVYGVYDVTGATDAIIIAKFKKRSDLSKFAKSLLAMEYVERTNTHVVLNTIKEDFRGIL